MAGLVTYSNKAKTKFLSVPDKIIARHGAVSNVVAERMAKGVRAAAGVDIGLSITGIAGPAGGSPEKPVGTVFMALATKEEIPLSENFSSAATGARFASARQKKRSPCFLIILRGGSHEGLSGFGDSPVPSKNTCRRLRKLMSQRVSGVKWVKAEGLHVTLKFFGEIEEKKVQEIGEALQGINKQHTAIPVQLKEINAFPDLMRPRVIVVTFQEGVDNVKAIFHDIESRLLAVGIEKEKRGFTPHITHWQGEGLRPSY